MRALRLVCCVAAVVVMAAGCSGSDAPTPTKSEFLKAGDQICKKGDAAVNKAADKAGVNDTKDSSKIKAFIVDEFVPNTRGQIADLRDLGYPKGDKDKLEGIYKDALDLLDDVEAHPDRFVSASDPFKDVNSRLKAYGFTSCGG